MGVLFYFICWIFLLVKWVVEINFRLKFYFILVLLEIFCGYKKQRVPLSFLSFFIFPFLVNFFSLLWIDFRSLSFFYQTRNHHHPFPFCLLHARSTSTLLFSSWCGHCRLSTIIPSTATSACSCCCTCLPCLNRRRRCLSRPLPCCVNVEWRHRLAVRRPPRVSSYLSPVLLRSVYAVLVTLITAVVLAFPGFAAATPSSFSCYCWSCWAVPLLLLSISNINSTSSRHSFAVPSCCCCRGCCCRGCPSSLHRL